jgi:hypothetical protein
MYVCWSGSGIWKFWVKKVSAIPLSKYVCLLSKHLLSIHDIQGAPVVVWDTWYLNQKKMAALNLLLSHSWVIARLDFQLSHAAMCGDDHSIPQDDWHEDLFSALQRHLKRSY